MKKESYRHYQYTSKYSIRYRFFTNTIKVRINDQYSPCTIDQSETESKNSK